MGACNVVSKMSGERVASDYHYELVELFKALQDGWIPPNTISEEEYKCAKMGLYPAYLTAFIGFGCSFGGKYFGGYARGKTNKGIARNYAQESADNLNRKKLDLKGVYFFSLPYTSYTPADCLIYCDPPYEGTTKYSNSSKFDHNLFWETMRKWSKDNTVIISEYSAPKDFTCIHEFEHTTGLKNNNGKGISKIERLFKC